MEYTISRFMKSALSIGIFILLLMTLPYIAVFVFSIIAFGFLVWGSFKMVKSVKTIIYRLSTKKNTVSQSNVYSSDDHTSEPADINYNDSDIIDVDYEKVE